MILNGGTTVVEYYLKLDWSELEGIGEGVLSFKCTNNALDNGFSDHWYNKLVEKTTEYYIASGVFINPDDAASMAEKLSAILTGIKQEINDRISEDSRLEEKIDTLNVSQTEYVDAETERAKAAETDLDDRLKQEITRATSAETELEKIITDEVVRALLEDDKFNTRLNVEHNERVSADTLIWQAITDESEIRSSSDTAIWAAINGNDDKVDAYVISNNKALADEVLRATTIENLISGKVDTYIAANDHLLSDEVARAKAAETDLLTKLNAEIGTRQTNVSDLTDLITNEVKRADEAEKYISGAVDSYIASNDTVVNALSGKVDSYINSNNKALADEVTRATNKENAISADVASYITSNNTRVSNVDTALADEVLRATTIENLISGKVDTNTANISANATAIQNETLRATVVESVISGKVDTLLSLQSQVTKNATDINTLNANVSTISGNVGTNYYTKAEVDAKFEDTNSFDSDKYYNKSDVNGLFTAEVARATAADSALETRIAYLEGVISILLANNLDKLKLVDDEDDEVQIDLAEINSFITTLKDNGIDKLKFDEDDTPQTMKFVGEII